MREAFAEYQDRLVPPSKALTETLEKVQKAMAAGGALLAYLEGVAVGTARYQIRSDHLYVERVGVVPEYRRRGVSAALMTALEDVARRAGLLEIRLGVRASLPSNLRHYEISAIAPSTQPRIHAGRTSHYTAETSLTALSPRCHQ